MTTTTRDVPIIRYGTADGHQPDSKPIESSVSLYAGQVAATRAGYLIQPDTAVQSTDVCWGVLSGILDSAPPITTPMSGGTTAGLHVAEIYTGTFYLVNGTSSDELTEADVGADVYLIDGQTVGKTSGGNTRPIAGKLIGMGGSAIPKTTGKVAVKIGNNQSTGSP